MRPFLVLLYKELRQNALLFLVPVAILLLLVAAGSAHLLTLAENLRNILAVAVPVALAVAYGLQTFDLEENDRTRDFLLTKPVTPRQVFAAKYLSGFALLLFSALLWVWAMIPEAIKPPSFADYSTFWFVSYLFLVAAVYTACVLAGVLIRGPQKVLFGTVQGGLAAAWFFAGFYAILAFIMQTRGSVGPFWAWSAVMCGLALLLFLVVFLAKAACWFLTNTPFRTAVRTMLIYLIALCLLPSIALAAGALTRPAIRPFDSLFSTFLGQEQWFAAIAGAKQPGGEFYAFADAHGRLGLGQKGQKPAVVYEAANKEAPLSSLAWSPDGRRVTFHENDLIVMYEKETGKTTPIMYGEAALWSTDPQKMLVLQAPGDDTGKYGLCLVDLAKRTYKLTGSLGTTGFDLAWDSGGSRLLVIEQGWRLRLIGLETGASQTLDLAPYPGCTEIAFAGRFFPPDAAGARRFAVFAADRAMVAKKRRLFNVYFYELNPRRPAPTPLGAWRRVFYEDLAGDSVSDEILGGIGLGLYRAIPMPKKSAVKTELGLAPDIWRIFASSRPVRTMGTAIP